VRTATLILLLSLSFSAASLFAGQAGSPQIAEYCGDCHRAIYDGWKQSAHASAMESRLFQDAMKLAGTDYGNAARKVCLNCHSPAGVLTGDFSLVRKVSWEGITCDYCHSIREVSLSGPNPVARVDFNNVKSGPYKDVVSPAHGTVFSAVHTSSLLCATCHEYRNSLGFPVLTTYSEWKASAYAKEGKQCQSCHMFSVSGDVVDSRVLPVADHEINLHQMPGSHSIQQLNRAILTRLLVSRDAGQVNVTVKLTNAGAGHFVPTGSPLRQLILKVRFEPYGGARAVTQERVYARTVVDQKGAVVQVEPAAFLRGAKVVKDTRIAPRETRTETFLFDLPPGKHAQVQADLYYFYSPMASSEQQRMVRFVTMSRQVP
jgi:Cytochrome c554 and c-prime